MSDKTIKGLNFQKNWAYPFLAKGRLYDFNFFFTPCN